VSLTHKIPDVSGIDDVRHRGKQADAPISASIITGVWIAAEFAIVLLVGFGTFHLIIEWRTSVQEYYASAICFFALASFLLIHFAGLYSFSAIVRPFEIVDKLIIAFGTAFLLFLAVAFSLKVSEIFSRIWMYTFALSACGAVVAARIAGSVAVRRLASKGVFVRNIAVLGGGDQGKQFLSHVAKSKLNFASIVGVFDDRLERVGPVVEGHQVMGNVSDLIEFARTHRVDDVVVALPWSASERLRSIVNRLRELPVNDYLSSDLVECSFVCREAPGHFEQAPMVEILDTPTSGRKTVL